MFNTQDTALIALFNKLGPGVIRFLGEQALVPVIWDPNGRGLQYGTVSTADIARLAAFLKVVNWKVLYGLDLVNGTAEEAASEAAVAQEEFGDSLLGFEIGNEPDNYANATIYGNPPTAQIADYSWADYISINPVYSSSGALLPSWPAYASAIQAAAPGAPLTGPGGGYNWVMNFAGSDQASRVSLLTRHYYATYPGESPTMTELLTQDRRVPKQFPAQAQAVEAAGISGGYRTAECNSVSGIVPGLGDGFGAALWTIDFLFENAIYQSTGVNFHGGGSGPGSFSPLQDNLMNVTAIGPDYYGMFAYAMLVHGGTMLSTQVTPAVGNFSAYAVAEPDGSTDLILSNKDPNNSTTVAVTPQNTISQASSLLMTAPSLTSTSGFELGGSPINIDGSWTPSSNPVLPLVGNAAVVTVPAGSAQIVHLQ
jgi:hypothetical protein